ncbi:MAG: porin PorA family protein [Thermodesulfobacteriota bacterium]
MASVPAAQDSFYATADGAHWTAMGARSRTGQNNKAQCEKKTVKGRFFFLAGLIFLAAVPVWRLLFEPRLTLRIPPGWSIQTEYLGNLLWADAQGNIDGPKNLNLYKRSFAVREWRPDRAVIEDLYQTIDVQSGAVTWETTIHFLVDPQTGTIISHDKHPEATGLFYVFPQNTEKSQYQFFNYDLYPYTMHYKRTEMLDGMEIYVFSFQGKLDFTDMFHAAYSNSPIPIGNRRMITEDFYRELWVEPVSGELVRIIENDPGDYLVDPETGMGKMLYCVWSGKTTGNTVKHLLQLAKKRRWELEMFRVWLPALLLTAALLCLATATLFHLSERRRP